VSGSIHPPAGGRRIASGGRTNLPPLMRNAIPSRETGQSTLRSLATSRAWTVAATFGALAVFTGSAAAEVASLRDFHVVGDAIPEPLSGRAGDADRGRSIVVNRQTGLCLLCHSGPFPEERFQGSLAPDLRGAGSRWSEGQLRLRLVDSSRLNRDTIMPSYYRIDQLERVGRVWQGKPVLTAEEIEDVVAFLIRLRD
jgi:L-cysteine S-thiosulfotransferase